MDIKTGLLTLVISAVFLSCASMPQRSQHSDDVQLRRGSEDVQTRLVESANWALGRNKLVVRDRKFNMDCSGVVMAVYYRSGIDLQSFTNSYSGGGVKRLYSLMNDRHLLYKPSIPAPGDLLFWDNTYDQNEDGHWNDEFTHMGMVVQVDDKGNILYIHHNYRTGIVFAKMNMGKPDDLDLNSPMRARNAEPGHAPLWLSSHLLRQAARAYELAEK